MGEIICTVSMAVPGLRVQWLSADGSPGGDPPPDHVEKAPAPPTASQSRQGSSSRKRPRSTTASASADSDSSGSAGHLTDATETSAASESSKLRLELLSAFPLSHVLPYALPEVHIARHGSLAFPANILHDHCDDLRFPSVASCHSGQSCCTRCQACSGDCPIMNC